LRYAVVMRAGSAMMPRTPVIVHQPTRPSAVLHLINAACGTIPFRDSDDPGECSKPTKFLALARESTRLRSSREPRHSPCRVLLRRRHDLSSTGPRQRNWRHRGLNPCTNPILIHANAEISRWACLRSPLGRNFFETTSMTMAGTPDRTNNLQIRRGRERPTCRMGSIGRIR